MVQVLVVAILVAGLEFIVPQGDASSRFSPRRALQAAVILLFLLYKLGFSIAGRSAHAYAPARTGAALAHKA